MYACSALIEGVAGVPPPDAMFTGRASQGKVVEVGHGAAFAFVAADKGWAARKSVALTLTFVDDEVRCSELDCSVLR